MKGFLIECLMTVSKMVSQAAGNRQVIHDHHHGGSQDSKKEEKAFQSAGFFAHLLHSVSPADFEPPPGLFKVLLIVYHTDL